MTVIRLSGFDGANKAVHPKLLRESVAVESINAKPGRGDFRPWRQPKTVATIPAGAKTIYRMGRDVASDSQYWLSWPSVVHAIRGFIADDTTEQTFYSGDGGPKVTDSTMALASAPYPTASRPLGIPAPTAPVRTTVIDPSPEVLQAGAAARTEVLIQPRQITQVQVTEEYVGAFTGTLVRNVRVWLADMTGITAGAFSRARAVTVNCAEHPSISVSDKKPWRVGADFIEYTMAINSGPLIAQTVTTGTVTTRDDTVFYPEVPQILQDPNTFGIRQTQFYTYTYVNDWGWESAPAPPSAQVDAFSSSSVTLSGFAAPPAGNYGINRIRIYRTQAGASGSAEFFFLREVAAGTSSTSDDGRNLGEVLPTTTWLPAPDDLSHLTALWNGMAAGISGNSVRFCESYAPYAWPIAYDVVPPDAKPVALGVFGQTLLLLTTGRPLLVAGSSPESMDQQPLEFSQGCVAPRSVATMGAGVVWASDDGLCWYGSGGARILTTGIMLREDWQALKPSSIIGKMYEGLYFGSYDDGSGRKGFFINPADPQGIYFMDAGYAALHFDELSDQLYVLDGNAIEKWDAGSTFMTARFKSKDFYTPKPQSFSSAQVVADAYPVVFRLYADGVLKLTHSVQNSNAFRLPSGFLAQHWAVELEATTPIQQAAIATSTTELTTV